MSKDYDAFFAMFEVYERELNAYDPEPFNIEAYRAAILEDLALEDSGRELFWIELTGQSGSVDAPRAGFCMTRTLPDWPDDSTNIAEVTEFYLDPAYRRQGAGRAAIEVLLATHRARGTRLVEAAILRDNAPAHAFWRALGFEVHSVRTTRRP
jgi:ribosomal protein S18 acetylase RimI-like enzyme